MLFGGYVVVVHVIYMLKLSYKQMLRFSNGGVLCDVELIGGSGGNLVGYGRPYGAFVSY